MNKRWGEIHRLSASAPRHVEARGRVAVSRIVPSLSAAALAVVCLGATYGEWACGRMLWCGRRCAVGMGQWAVGGELGTVSGLRAYARFALHLLDIMLRCATRPEPMSLETASALGSWAWGLGRRSVF